MKFNRFLLYCCLLAIACVPAIGAPFLLIKNKAAKCFKLEHIKPETTLKIAYYAPDIVIQDKEEENAEKVEGQDETGESDPAAVKADDGLDARYNERRKRRMDLMKSSRMKDVNIVVVQRYPEKTFSGPDPKQQNIQPRPPTKKVRVQLEDQQGEFFFRTNDTPYSIVEVCVQSYFATVADPSRVSLNITSSEDSIEIEKEGTQGLSPEDIETIQKSNRVIRSQTSGITQELMRLEKKLHDIMRDINQSSRQTADHQEKSLKLSKAVRYWPIFRVCVLLLGGYLQVSHVINYMQRRHIF